MSARPSVCLATAAAGIPPTAGAHEILTLRQFRKKSTVKMVAVKVLKCNCKVEQTEAIDLFIYLFIIESRKILGPIKSWKAAGYLPHS